MKLDLNYLTLPAALLMGAVIPVHGNSFNEPPAVLYGKVLQRGDGASYQLFRGAAEFTIVNTSDSANRLVIQTQLRRVGGDGAFSYRLELPQRYLPADEDLEENLVVDHLANTFEVTSIAIDGQAARPLEVAAATIANGFALKAGQHRLDLMVSLDEADADGDSMPDWWEDLHALHRYSATDSAGDLDGDGLTNVEEFRLGTDPGVANTSPLLRNRRLAVPSGGTAGLALSIIDVDSAPDAIELTIGNIPDGLTLQMSGVVLTAGEAITYEDVLEGRVTAAVSGGFGGGNLDLVMTDLDNGVSENVEVAVDPFFPGWGSRAPRPAIWLNANALTSGPVSEWGDLSGKQRDAYQPEESLRPIAGDGVVRFDGDGFLYVDDRDLTLGDGFAIFAMFEGQRSAVGSQSLFQSSEISVQVAGDSEGAYPGALVVTQAGRLTRGRDPVGGATQVSFLSSSGGAYLRSGDGGYSPSVPSEDVLPQSFTTVGGFRAIGDVAPSQLFEGGLRELVIYDRILEPGERDRLEDYQRARWGELTVWDYRDESVPLAITGHHSSANALNGGWGNDILTGGALDDVLRGGMGDDDLTGGEGADRFVFVPEVGAADTVRGFSVEEGDVLDLTDIFGEESGDPATFVTLRSEFEVSGQTKPVVHTVLDLRHEGASGEVSQTITLLNTTLSRADLPRLVADGVILLGGPRYPTTIMLAAEELSFPATPTARQIVVSRSGESDADSEVVPLEFSGTAELGRDYTVSGVVGEGAVRSLEFAPGETLKVISVTPAREAGVTQGIATITIATPLDPDFVTKSPLTLTITEVPVVRLDTRSHATIAGRNPGVVVLSRTGPVDRDLTVQLGFSGSARMGVVYENLPSSATIPAGSTMTELHLVPRSPEDPSESADPVLVARLRVVEEPGGMHLLEPGSTTVSFFREAGSASRESFAQWKARQFPGDSDRAVGERDDDRDGLTNLWEYIHGTDPKTRDRMSDFAVDVSIVDSYLEVAITSVGWLTDVHLEIEGSTDLQGWTNADDLVLVLRPVPGSPQQFRQVFRSPRPLRTGASPASRLLRYRAFDRSDSNR